MACYTIVLFVMSLTQIHADVNYLVGTGIWDVTGPAAEINMMGYAKGSQLTNGIHMRQYSRAFVFSDLQQQSRVVFVSVDAAMISSLVTREVVKQLNATYPGIYNETNVCISGIHTHSGPGGFHEYLLFDITSLGYVKQSAAALIEGIFQSIKQAHERMQPANIYYITGNLTDANINRSPTSYLQNPAEERAKYVADTDTEMTVLKITDTSNHDIGMISWFPVHCTSMNNTNGYISGDNKGYASQQMERLMNPGKLPHQVTFVAAFAQANEGDVSPNTKGPHCLDTGLPCDPVHSTCNNRTELCVAFGPGNDMFESTQIIGTKQFEKALSLYSMANISGTQLSGRIEFRHQYVDMSNYAFTTSSGKKVNTCPPAMGYSFAAGTTDGPGDFNFIQGTNSTNPFWNLISQFLSKPTPEQIACQAPKPILLNTGQITFPYAWQPAIVPVQILKIGGVIIAGLPAEFTTMSGRRLRNAIKQVYSDAGKDFFVVLAGLSNDYADYVATYEEYQAQRYEAGSTIYGPYTLDAYIDLFKKLAYAMTQNQPVEPGQSPPDLSGKQISFVLPVIYDSVASGQQFGQPISDAQDSYKQGDLVNVTFNSADPRNDLMTMKSFLYVDQQQADGTWLTVYTDSHWETKFKWTRTNTMLGRSIATITWQISDKESPGTYRIRHEGSYKPLTESPKPFTGTTKSFNVGPKE